MVVSVWNQVMGGQELTVEPGKGRHLPAFRPHVHDLGAQAFVKAFDPQAGRRSPMLAFALSTASSDIAAVSQPGSKTIIIRQFSLSRFPRMKSWISSARQGPSSGGSTKCLPICFLAKGFMGSMTAYNHLMVLHSTT